MAVSVNTDDPALLDTSLEGEYALCRDTFGWSDDDVRSVARTSIDASFANADIKARLIEALSKLVIRRGLLRATDSCRTTLNRTSRS